MTIRISRNTAGNCLNFIGSSLPAYYNACLSGVVDADTGTINVVNDIQTQNNPNGEVRYVFYNIPYTEFSDKDGNEFANAQACADYITQEGNVLGVSDVGTDLTGVVVNFRLDQTSTSIIMDNGAAFGVNTIKAVPDADGTIHIHAIGAGVPEDSEEPNDHKHYEKLEVSNVQINGSAVPGGINDVCNALNELFTVGPFESVVISDPFSTMVADVGGTVTTGTILGTNGVDPIGDDIFGASATGSLNGYKTTETIDQAGEYFTFDIRNEGQIGFGLVVSDAAYAAGDYAAGSNSSYINPATFGTSNSAHYGFQWSHWFHPTPNGSWTQYGAKTGYVMGPGWYSSNTEFEARDEWLAGDPIKIRVGIDENGYIYVSSLKDDGVTWVLHARTNYPVPDGFEAHLGVKMGDTTARLYTQPKVHLLEPAAPTLYFRYIESPDGFYNFPLFATQEEADYYEEQVAGADNGSHAHQYEDDPTSTTWYMPETSNQMNYGLTPVEDGVTTFLGNAITWTEITSLTNADLAPPAYTDQTVSVNELQSVNIQTQPQDTAYTTTFSGLPVGLLSNAGDIFGTAPEVTGDNVANPSDDYAVTVTRTNNYGSSTGTLTIRVNNLTAPTVATGSWSVNTGTITSGVLQNDSTANTSFTLGEGERVIIPKEWVEAHLDPNNMASGAHAILGVLENGADLSDVAYTDFAGCIRWYGITGTTSHGVTLFDELGGVTQSSYFTNSGSSVYDYALELYSGSLYLIACNINSINNEPAVALGGSFSRTMNCGAISGGSLTAPLNITLGTNGSNTIDLDDALTTHDLTKITIPTAASNETSWTKALDFSGSSERTQQANSSPLYTPLKMGGTANTVAAPTAGQTVSSGYPWATACVFKIDGHSSNQHIWNLGEGAGDNDDNIYLRLDASRNLYFGWGRSGALNELFMGTGLSTTQWYGAYIGFNGTRLSGANATAANLADCFDIRLYSSGTLWQEASATNSSTEALWLSSSSSTGGRMDREFNGYLHIGGRGANRSFHGKVASFVSTTLRCGVAMPTTAEITEMVTDPVGWVNDYKIGNSYRRPSATTDSSNFQRNSYDPAAGTQVWLMGDGVSDSYSNMIRSYIYPSEQNRYKLNMISMVSSDIENVTISGLS